MPYDQLLKRGRRPSPQAYALPALSGTTTTTTYSDPVITDETTTSVHGGLPGGDHSRWTTAEGETSYTDWAQTGDPVVTGNTTVVTETRLGTRTDEALNPAGRTVGTDRFDPTTSWTETRTVTTTVTVSGGNPCGGNCGLGLGGGGGNGTENEGKGKGKSRP